MNLFGVNEVKILEEMLLKNKYKYDAESLYHIFEYIKVSRFIEIMNHKSDQKRQLLTAIEDMINEGQDDGDYEAMFYISEEEHFELILLAYYTLNKNDVKINNPDQETWLYLINGLKDSLHMINPNQTEHQKKISAMSKKYINKLLVKLELTDNNISNFGKGSTFIERINHKNEQKRKLLTMIEDMMNDEQDDGNYEAMFYLSDEEHFELILLAYYTLNKNDVKINNPDQETWLYLINGLKDSLHMINPNQTEHQKKISAMSKKYINKLLVKLELTDNNISNFGKSKIPDNVINKKLYSKIKTKIQKEVKRKKRRWGAYDSGRLVKQYKADGGKYKKNSRSSSSSSSSELNRWYKEKWIDACKWPKKSPCGRSQSKKGITYCRPSVRINSKTPKTIQEYSKKEIKSKCDRKKKNGLKIIRN